MGARMEPFSQLCLSWETLLQQEVSAEGGLPGSGETGLEASAAHVEA